MNTRQWDTYEIIKSRSLNGLWTSRLELYQWNKAYPEVKGEFGKSSSARMINEDIHEINENDVIQKIIISNSYKGYRLANEHEMESYIKKRRIEAFKKLKHLSKLMKKAGLNNQSRITFTEHERSIIESLLKGEIK